MYLRGLQLSRAGLAPPEDPPDGDDPPVMESIKLNMVHCFMLVECNMQTCLLWLQ